MRIKQGAVGGLYVVAGLLASHAVLAQEKGTNGPVAQEAQGPQAQMMAPGGETVTVQTTQVTMAPELPPPSVPLQRNEPYYGAGGRDVGGAAKTGIDHPVPPPVKAIELTIGGGYAQGVGDIGSNAPTVPDIAGPGGSIQASIGYRFTKHLSAEFYGTGSMFSRNNGLPSGTDVWSSTAGIQATWHFRPWYSIDPWVSLASGWRGMWTNPSAETTTTRHGLQIARLQIGVDFRFSQTVAIAPVIGADVSMFLTQDVPGVPGGFNNISSPDANYFFFGGLAARFDVMGAGGQHARTADAPSRFGEL
jgi:hypothetical protein